MEGLTEHELNIEHENGGIFRSVPAPEAGMYKLTHYMFTSVHPTWDIYQPNFLSVIITRY
jgi:hypothetical protein